MPRRVLIVSPHFPPSTVAGVHRARHLVKHLPAAGWNPTILCVDESYHAERLDPGLARLLPDDLDLVKVPALPASRMRYIGIGDIGIRAYPFLSQALSKVIQSREIDVVMMTGSPFYPFLLAKQVKRKLGRPVVLDFQDPWVSRWGATRPPLTKAWAAYQIARWLEPLAVKNADFITSVSELQNDEFSKRYPAFPPDRLAALPIGGDPDDHMQLRTHLSPKKPENTITFSYVGSVWPRSEPVFEIFFAAIAKVIAFDEPWVRRLRFNFVGTSAQPNGFGKFKVIEFAKKHGVIDFVTEIPQRVPYLQALDILSKSHALILIGSDEPHYTASKIYPSLLSGRPILALFHNASSAIKILQLSGGAYILGFDTIDDLTAMTGAIADAIRRIALEPAKVSHVNRSVIADFEASAIAVRYAEIFNRLIAK